MHIHFAYQPFKWRNNAKANAGVSCIIVGLTSANYPKKKLYSNGLVYEVENINGYLAPARNLVVTKRTIPISDRPKMDCGSKATDGGNLMLSKEVKESLIDSNPEAESYIKNVYGAEEFLNGSSRWCLWITDEDLPEALLIPEINQRVKLCAEYRLSSSKAATRKKSITSHKFDEVKHLGVSSIIVPTVTSEKREYLPVGYLGENDIVIAPNNALYNPEIYVFGLLSSKLHMVWVKAVSGQLESRIRYSSSLCYNSFPIPELTNDQKSEITGGVFDVLEAREGYPDKTLSQLYDPEDMPKKLRMAHDCLDHIVERIYRKEPFNDNDERLDFLFSQYEKILGAF